jgi:hypothetical protein
MKILRYPASSVVTDDFQKETAMHFPLGSNHSHTGNASARFLGVQHQAPLAPGVWQLQCHQHAQPLLSKQKSQRDSKKYAWFGSARPHDVVNAASYISGGIKPCLSVSDGDGVVVVDM